MVHRIRYKKNGPQREFHNDMSSFLLHLSMGFGGGKTHALCKKAFQLSMLNKGLPGGLVSVDYSEFKKDVLPEMEQILDDNKISYRYHKTDHWFEFPWSIGRLYVISADKKIRGPNWAYACINELTLIPLTRYKEVFGRIRVKKAKCPQVASVGTPEGFASEYYEYLIEKPPKKLRIIYGSSDDNKENLNENYFDLLEDTFDIHMMDAYRRGLWVNMNSNRFYYAYNPTKNHDDTLKPNFSQGFVCSMDFNVDPMTATLWHYDGYSIFGVDQVLLEGDKGYNTQNMCDALKTRGYNGANTIIYPDPAGNARTTKGKPDNEILRQNGFQVVSKSSAPQMRKRQLNCNNLLDKGRIRFNSLVCTGIKKDLSAVEQDKITLEKVKKNPKLTHFSDGMDYMVDNLFPFSGDLKTLRQEKIR